MVRRFGNRDHRKRSSFLKLFCSLDTTTWKEFKHVSLWGVKSSGIRNAPQAFPKQQEISSTHF